MKTNRHFRPSYESLENRQLLAITAGLSGGSLLVEGDAVGAVEIMAVDEDSYKVSEGAGLQEQSKDR